MKLTKKIPCHTKNEQVMMNENNENRFFEKSNITNESSHKDEFISVPLNESEVVDMKKIPPNEVDEDEKNKRQDFEIQKKEELNKMKRSLLQEAISKHTEKTQAEAKKLDEIKQSLDILDSELSNDVGILRREIEVAAYNFNSIEKRYNAIEKSFLKAKQDLYQAHEKKEMLTEHLYKIIAHNEDRKAKRLGELMEKVGLTINENNL